MLKDGNKRFVDGSSKHPHTSAKRLKQANIESQNAYAYATVISCSDSRVPVERIFDAGIMDVFTIRVIGNVCNVDEIGSIEYGLAHVRTPVLVVLGHTKCGAVTVATRFIQKEGYLVERNIPQLIYSIEPAVLHAMHRYPNILGDDIIPYAIEENVWQGVINFFMDSPSTRKLVREGLVKVIGAVYDVGTGKVKFLPSENVRQILKDVKGNPSKKIKSTINMKHK